MRRSDLARRFFKIYGKGLLNRYRPGRQMETKFPAAIARLVRETRSQFAVAKIEQPLPRLGK